MFKKLSSSSFKIGITSILKHKKNYNANGIWFQISCKKRTTWRNSLLLNNSYWNMIEYSEKKVGMSRLVLTGLDIGSKLRWKRLFFVPPRKKDFQMKPLQMKGGSKTTDVARCMASKLWKAETSSGWKVSLKRGNEEGGRGPGRCIAMYRKVFQFEPVASGLVQVRWGWQRLGGEGLRAPRLRVGGVRLPQSLPELLRRLHLFSFLFFIFGFVHNFMA